MRDDALRTWGPVGVVLALLPVAFVLLRAALPPIGAPAPTPAPAPAAPEPPGAGTRACGECHAAEAAAWAASTHASAERELRPGDPTTLVAVGPDGKEATFALVRALGVDPLVQYLVDSGGGRLQVTQAATRTVDGSWFDVFADGRGPGEWGHWTGDGMTWNSRCAECHTTGFRKNLDPRAGRPRYASTYAALGVTCAACHRDHTAGDGPAGPAPERVLDTCGSCHARRSALDEAFRPGDPLLDHFAPALVGPTDAFRPDGGVRDEDFEWTAFVGSRMHGAGVTCTSCHDPHTGRTKAEGDALCLSCHAAMPTFRPHDRHAETVGCVACHLPTTVYMQADPRHDHAISIPDPALERDFGVPSACARCHADRGVAFAVAAAEDWWGRTGPDPRSAALASARRGDAAAVPALIDLTKAGRPAWRGAAALHLEPFVDRPEVRDTLRGLLADPEPLVRFAAATAVAPFAPEVDAELAELARDPLKAIRVSATRARRARVGPNDAAAREYAAYLSLHADDAQALYERATWALERGAAAAALADLERAVASDAGSPPILDALAFALASVGRDADAAATLRRAVALAPGDAELHLRLGLAEAGAGDAAAAERALRAATAADPGLARAWYNLGLLLAERGGGLPELERAVALDPGDVDLRYALASVLAGADRKRAVAELDRVLAAAPDHAGAAALRARLVP